MSDGTPAAPAASAPAAAPAAASPAPAATTAAPAAAPAAPSPAAPAAPVAPAATAPAKPAEPKPVEPSFPDNWRELMAGGDAKKLESLKRYASPQAVLDAHMQLRGRMDSGELKGPFPKDGKPEAQAAWRKANSVPEAPEQYDITMPDGLVVGEDDLPIVNEVRKAMHEVNAPQAVLTKALTAYYKMRAAEESARDDRDLEHKSQSEEALRQEWGVEYKQNVNAISNFITQTFGEDAKRLLGARLADGKPLGNDPAILRGLAAIAREMNPMHTVTGISGPAAIQNAEAELAKLNTMMGDRSSEYWRGDNAQKNQARWRELTSALDKQKSRAA